MSDTNSRDSFEYLSEDDQDPTLESILAEFKGSAYIAGEKRTSPDLLDERIKRIVEESQTGRISHTELYTLSDDDGDFFHDIRTPYGEEEVQEEPVTLTKEDKKYAAKTAEIEWEPVRGVTSFDEVRREAAAFFAKRDEAVEKREEELLLEKQEARKRAEEERRRKEEEELRLREEQRRLEDQRKLEETKFFDFDASDDEVEQPSLDYKTTASDDVSDDTEEKHDDDKRNNEILFFDNYRFADDEDDEEYANDDYGEYDELQEEKKQGLFARLLKKREPLFDDEEYANQPVEEYEPEPEPEPEPEIYIEEPDFGKEASYFTRVRNLMMLKSRLALTIAAVMGLFSILFDKGVDIFGIGDNVAVFTSVMVLMQLVVMALSLEIINRGIVSVFNREIGPETLVVISNIITVVTSCVSIILKGDGMGAPFCAVSALSTAFSLWGEYRQFAAMSLSMKTAVATSNPQVLSGQYVKDLDASIIRKYYSSAEGFYNNLVETDISDTVYRMFAPLLLIIALLLSAVSAVGGHANFIYALSAAAAACASFSAMSAFSVPFSMVAKRLRRSGAAVAGWGGADDIYYADGVRLTDADVFPDGAQISGPTALENVKPDKILRYSASLMIASNSGLSKGFEELIEKQGIAMVGVENFECYEGGYAATIRGERVVCGSAACMALLGIKIPQSVNAKNAIFTAINDTLVGTFTVTYKPLKTVQTSLLTLLGSNIKLFFAVRDFNITPLMVQQKLQIPVDDIEYMPTVDA
ncbi:MAG: hypothetical protein IJO77_00540, partial [Oscillospiraceae bacterium]|nr:hypothetical protein [Oscillospiraceae bacterium]